MVLKIKKNMFDVLTLLMRCALLQCGKGFNARGTFLEISLTVPFFSAIVWTDILHYFDEGI